MKKCLKCGKEYPDSDSFCPVCGERLSSVNVCQKCGNPVEVNDVFCRHCGYKIEKEYKCQACGLKIPAGSKFCPECGAKVENPEVTIAMAESKNQQAFSSSNVAPSTQKTLFILFNVLLLVLMVVMLVGCFGDIFVSRVNSSGSVSTSKESISYFFGDAIKEIKNASSSYKYQEFTIYSVIMLILEYVCWLGAITMVVIGLVIGIKNFYKGYMSNNYSFKHKNYVYAITGALPYLFIFSAFNSAYLSATYSYDESSRATSTLEAGLGWGPMMILIAAIIGVCLLALHKVVVAFVEKKNIVRESIIAVAKITLFIVFVLSLGNAVAVDYSTSSATISGYLTVDSVFVSDLASYSSDAIKNLTPGSVECLIGTILLFISGLGAVALFDSLFASENKIAVYVSAVVVFATMLAGYIVAYNGLLEYLKSASLYGLASQAFKYSAMGIVTPIILVASIVSITVAKNLKPAQQANA